MNKMPDITNEDIDALILDVTDKELEALIPETDFEAIDLETDVEGLLE